MDFVYTEMDNIAIETLRRQIQLEVEVARKADNLFSYSLGVLALICSKMDMDVDYDYLLSKFQKIKEEINLGNINLALDIELIIGLVLAFKLLSELKEVKSMEKEVITALLHEVKDRNWLESADLASYTLFALSGLNDFEKINESAKFYLLKTQKKIIKHSRKLSPKLITAIFGLSFTDAQVDEGISNILDFSSIDRLNLKELAKLGIVLNRYNNEKFSKEINLIASKIEDRIRKEFYESESFRIREGIRNAASLIAAGFSEEESNNYLETLELSDLIKIRSESIVLKVPSPKVFPSIDTEGHSLALIFFSLIGREKLYVLDKNSLELARRGISTLKEGFVPIKRSQIVFIKWLLPALILSLSISIALNMGVSREDILIAIGFLYKSDILTALGLLKTPMVILFIGVWFALFFTRVLDRIIEDGCVDRTTLIVNAPFINRIYKLLKGRNEQDGK